MFRLADFFLVSVLFIDDLKSLNNFYITLLSALNEMTNTTDNNNSKTQSKIYFVLVVVVSTVWNWKLFKLFNYSLHLKDEHRT